VDGRDVLHESFVERVIVGGSEDLQEEETGGLRGSLQSSLFTLGLYIEQLISGQARVSGIGV
jgi:hypothetical protein